MPHRSDRRRVNPSRVAALQGRTAIGIPTRALHPGPSENRSTPRPNRYAQSTPRQTFKLVLANRVESIDTRGSSHTARPLRSLPSVCSFRVFMIAEGLDLPMPYR